eukprot:258299_1
MEQMLQIKKKKEIAVTLNASSFLYDEETDCWRVKFSESTLISQNKISKTITILIPSIKVQTNSQTAQLKDEDIDSILDEIAQKEKSENKPDDKHKAHHQDHPKSEDDDNENIENDHNNHNQPRNHENKTSREIKQEQLAKKK